MKQPKFYPLFICLFFFSLNLHAQTPYAPEALTKEDYQRGEDALRQNTSKLVFNTDVRANWIDDHRFWYRNNSPDGIEFVLVDAKNKSRKTAFDHAKLAAALSTEEGTKVSAGNLPFRSIKFSENGNAFSFKTKGGSYYFDLDNQKLNTVLTESSGVKAPRYSSYSPDRKKAVYIKDHNLWMINMINGKEKQLTFDGIEDFGYATNNAGWVKRDNPIVLWSPDSKKIATFQHDGRGVGEMYTVKAGVGHPTLRQWKYPMPGDSLIFRISRVVIHTDDARVVRLKMDPDAHRSSVTDHIAVGRSTLADAEWSADSKHLSFLSSSRDHKEAILRIADPETGNVRDILEERVKTFFESGSNAHNWRVLTESNEVIWYSQRQDWANLYLYDLTTGKLKNQITKGNWNVYRILKVDEANRHIYFYGMGKEVGNPYYLYLYRVDFEGTEVKSLTHESANHYVALSPTGEYFIDNYSTTDSPTVSMLRNKEGKLVVKLEKTDISQLEATGWKPPTEFTVKARDGKTDLYGLMYKPVNFDEKKKYPIINYIYPGPQSGSVGRYHFSTSRRDNQSLANLGFIVVALDAMGTPNRSKSFHEAYYGNMGDNGLPDQITGMKQLADRHPWIDLSRAGIYGHSGGGYASTAALLQYPDFFKVAVSGAGNHDNRNYEDDWGEKWHGLLVVNEDGTTNYDNQANQLLVENLKGKLLIAHGTNDTNVPIYNTYELVDKLIAANKDFDLIAFPNRGHGFANEPYMLRKRWDYFVQHLMGAVPPKEHTFGERVVQP